MESVSRMSGILGTTHSLTLDAARDAAFFRKTQNNPALRDAQIRKLLDSRHEREVIEGLRTVIALSHKPPKPNEPLLFSSVLKNIASPSAHVKKLVYIHLLQYAESDPDTALLSINTIQKTLSHSDPHLRALALRVMSGIRVPVISQIVLLAIKKGTADMSPLVRKAAALAIPKCARLDPGTTAQLEEFMNTLLGDRQYFVAGAAVQAFMEVYGWDRLDMVHKHYRGLVKKMVDMDEWGQIATLRLMVGYARRCFPRRWKKSRRKDNDAFIEKDFYGEEQGENARGDDGTDLEQVFDPDLQQLLRSAQLLLHSRNSAVIISATRLYLALAPESAYLPSCVGPLIALLRAPSAIAETALFNTLQIALFIPSHFLRYTTHFLLRTTDSSRMQELKLEMLTLLFPHANARAQSLILAELSHFCSTPSTGSEGKELVSHCVRAIGRCALGAAPGSRTANRCMRLLLSFLSASSTAPAANSGSSNQLVAETLTVLRHLIQADPSAHISTVTRLAKNLDGMRDPSARASVVWLVGEYAGLNNGDNISADVLRILARGFANEEEVVRAQIVLLAAKVYCIWLNKWHEEHPLDAEDDTRREQANGTNGSPPTTSPRYDFPDDEGGFRSDSPPPSDAEPANTTNALTAPPSDHPIPVLYSYIQTLARYDTSYDLRDRARVYRSLLSVPSSTQLASLLLLAPKPVPIAQSPSETRKDFMLGSASLVLGESIRGYESLPEWVEEGQEPDPGLRDESEVAKGGYISTSQVLRSASERLDVSVKETKPTKGVGDKSLDDWLAEEEEEEEASSGESSNEETEDEEDDTEGEESESGESEDEPDDKQAKGRLMQ